MVIAHLQFEKNNNLIDLTEKTLCKLIHKEVNTTRKSAKRRQRRKQLPPVVYSDKHGGKTLIKEMDFKLDLFTLA